MCRHSTAPPGNRTSSRRRVRPFASQHPPAGFAVPGSVSVHGYVRHLSLQPLRSPPGGAATPVAPSVVERCIGGTTAATPLCGAAAVAGGASAVLPHWGAAAIAGGAAAVLPPCGAAAPAGDAAAALLADGAAAPAGDAAATLPPCGTAASAGDTGAVFRWGTALTADAPASDLPFSCAAANPILGAAADAAHLGDAVSKEVRDAAGPAAAGGAAADRAVATTDETGTARPVEHATAQPVGPQSQHPRGPACGAARSHVAHQAVRAQLCVLQAGNAGAPAGGAGGSARRGRRGAHTEEARGGREGGPAGRDDTLRRPVSPRRVGCSSTILAAAAAPAPSAATLAAAAAPAPSAVAEPAASVPAPSAAAAVAAASSSVFAVMATQEATEDATPSASATTGPAFLGAVITPAQAAADGVARARAAAAAAAPPTAAERRANLDVAPAGPSPKKKAAGRRVAWTDDERLYLCKGWLKTTLDPVLGTNQTNTAFWNAMVDSSRNAMIEARLPGLEKRLERSDRIIERTFRYDITNATHRLNACRISAVKQQLTGALTEEDLDMASVALSNDKGPYQGMRREDSAIKCDFFSCWRFLRVHPTLSTKSAVEHMKLAGYKVSGEVVDVSDGDDNCVSLTFNKRRATGDADRFVGTKAAKAAFRSDISLERESAAHTAALNSLAKTSAERNELAKRKHTIEFWSMPHVRDTAQGKAFWENQLDARLAEDSGRTAAAGHLDTAASTVAAATPPSTAADARTTAAGTASTAATSLRASEVSDEATIEGTVSRSTSMTAAAPGAAARSDSIALKSSSVGNMAPEATSARRSAAAAAAASPRISTAAASTTGSRGGEAASPGAFTVPMSESPADTAAMAAARADEAAAEAARRRAEADEVLATAEAQRRAIEVATAAAADAKVRVAAAERLAHAKAQRLNAERRVCTGRYHLTDGDVSKAAAADVAAAKMAAAHSSAAANMAAAHMSVAANMAGAHKSAAATRHADVTVSDTTRRQAAAAAALAAATKRHAAVQEQLTRDKAAVAKAAAALAAVVESADEEVIDVVELVDADDHVVNGPRLRASRGAHGGNNKGGDGKRVVGMGDGDRGYGDKGDGENGDGDQSDGDKGEGDKGKGDQCEGDNGDGDEGDGNKGDGDKGDGDRGDGDKVDGDQGDVAAAALVTAPRRRGAHATAAMRTKQAAWEERRRRSEMIHNVDLALRRVAAEVDGSSATASSPRASSAATEADGNSASAAAPHSTSAACAADGNAGAAAALTMPGQAGHGPAASHTGGAARVSADASPNREAEIADADKELEDAESLGDDTEVAYEDDTLYLGTPSPPSSRRQRFRSCSSGRRPPLPPRQTANSSSESDNDSDADMSF